MINHKGYRDSCINAYQNTGRKEPYDLTRPVEILIKEKKNLVPNIFLLLQVILKTSLKESF